MIVFQQSGVAFKETLKSIISFYIRDLSTITQLALFEILLVISLDRVNINIVRR